MSKLPALFQAEKCPQISPLLPFLPVGEKIFTITSRTYIGGMDLLFRDSCLPKDNLFGPPQVKLIFTRALSWITYPGLPFLFKAFLKVLCHFPSYLKAVFTDAWANTGDQIAGLRSKGFPHGLYCFQPHTV